MAPNLPQVIAYRADIDTKQLCDPLLIQPKSLELVEHLYTHAPFGSLIKD
jgi:hypothetical protein